MYKINRYKHTHTPAYTSLNHTTLPNRYLREECVIFILYRLVSFNENKKQQCKQHKQSNSL